jgi:hypothetical protein
VPTTVRRARSGTHDGEHPVRKLHHTTVVEPACDTPTTSI